MMKHGLHEVWKEFEGAKIVWKLQAPKGILTFKTKTQAIKFKEAIKLEN